MLVVVTEVHEELQGVNRGACSERPWMVWLTPLDGLAVGLIHARTPFVLRPPPLITLVPVGGICQEWKLRRGLLDLRVGEGDGKEEVVERRPKVVGRFVEQKQGPQWDWAHLGDREHECAGCRVKDLDGAHKWHIAAWGPLGHAVEAVEVQARSVQLRDGPIQGGRHVTNLCPCARRCRRCK